MVSETGHSQAFTYAALAATSLVMGYWFGVGSTLPITRRQGDGEAHKNETKTEENSEGDSSDSDDEVQPGEKLSEIQSSPTDECKLVLIVRTDLGMTSGKIAAQCSHATLACYKALNTTNPTLLRHWERTGQTKVIVKCDNEEDLDIAEASARSLNLCARSIYDAGRTQIAAGSRTVLGVGPGPVRLVNQITAKFKLL